MKNIKEKILSLSWAREWYNMIPYSKMVWVNMWELYSKEGFSFDELVEHIMDELLEKWYMNEYKEVMDIMWYKDWYEIEKDKQETLRTLNFNY